MSRASHPRLSVVQPDPARRPLSEIELATYRETDIRLASERLHMAALRLQAIPRFPELADYRAGALERFEEAVNVMRDALK